MFYIGKWREVSSGEVISINEHLGGDRYCLDYCSDDGKVIKSEDVQIFISNSKHARIAYSNKLNGCDIIKLNLDRIQIGNCTYARQKA